MQTSSKHYTGNVSFFIFQERSWLCKKTSKCSSGNVPIFLSSSLCKYPPNILWRRGPVIYEVLRTYFLVMKMSSKHSPVNASSFFFLPSFRNIFFLVMKISSKCSSWYISSFVNILRFIFFLNMQASSKSSHRNVDYIHLH